MYLSETHEKKWQAMLEHLIYQKSRTLTDGVTSVILENQERA